MKTTFHDSTINPKLFSDSSFLSERCQFDRNFIFRKLFLASHKSRRAHRYLRSHASIDFEKHRYLEQQTHVIHPFSLFRFWWDASMALIIASGLILFPYQSGFDMRRTNLGSWTYIKNIILLLFCCDILINFCTGYFEKSQNVVELQWKAICIRYLKTRFIVDLLGSFPTDVLFIKYWNEYIVLRELASLLYIFRIFSFLTYRNQLARDFEIRRGLYDFLCTIFWLIIILHWEACLYWIISVANISLSLPQLPRLDWKISSSKSSSLENDISRYGDCFLRSVATFMHSGYLVGTEPRTEVDRYLVICFLIVNMMIFYFMIARFTQLFDGINSSKLKYQGTLAHLSQFMSQKQLPRKTQHRIISYFEFKFQRRYFKESEISSGLSMSLRQEIRMHSCCKLVENVTFFSNLPFSLLLRIVALLQSEIFLTNDLIVKANQTGDCMYFIASGTVAVYTYTGKEVCHLEDGAHFGEIALVMPDAKRVASVVAVETCKLYKLERADFARTIHPYPTLWERIKKIAIDRHEKTIVLN